MTKAIATLPQARHEIERLSITLTAKDNQIASLNQFVDETSKARDNVEKRFLAQSQELAQARKDIAAAYDARLEAQLGFARALGYIAALKGEPFNEDQGNRF
jgi:peptidoglycan hydrolase CwlO-like protein